VPGISGARKQVVEDVDRYVRKRNEFRWTEGEAYVCDSKCEEGSTQDTFLCSWVVGERVSDGTEYERRDEP